jgi:hypothetical protein
MKRSILSIMLLALIISLTVTVGSANLITAYAIENYLQLRSANVDYHGGDIDVDIRTGGNIPSESGNNGFGYAVLTDVGDESVDNVLVAISDIGLKNNDKSTKNDRLHTYVLDLTGDTSKACSGSDYEVTKSSSDNEAFDTSYPIEVKGNKISIDDVNTNDLASDTVKSIASFTAEAITNNGKIKQICIDIQDVLKQSEISVGYSSNNNDDHDNDDDKDKNRHKDENKKNNDDKNRKDHDDDSKKVDNDDDSLFETDIDQDIDQSNECSGSSTCSNEGSNEIDVFEPKNSVNDDGFDFDSNLDIDQSIEQSNECDGEASCSNEAKNEVDIGGSSSSDNSYIDGTDLNIDQFIGQSNTCGDEADCSNEGSNEANVFGYSSAADDEDYDFGSGVDISQSIEQSNSCSGEATCSNFASNVANIS